MSEQKVMTANNDRYIKHLRLTPHQLKELQAYNEEGAKFFKAFWKAERAKKQAQ